MARLVRCPEGHVFDPDEHNCCPQCGLPVLQAATGGGESAISNSDGEGDAKPKRMPAWRQVSPWIIAIVCTGIAAGATSLLIWRLSRPAPSLLTATLPKDQAERPSVAKPAVATTSAVESAASKGGTALKPRAAATPDVLPQQEEAGKPATVENAEAGKSKAQKSVVEPNQAIKRSAAARTNTQIEPKLTTQAPVAPQNRPASNAQVTGGHPKTGLAPAKHIASLPSSEQTAQVYPSVTPSPEVTAASITATVNAVSRDMGINGTLLSLVRLAIGTDLIDHNFTQLSADILGSLAGNGVPVAGVYLGSAYETGRHGFPRDIRDAGYWLEKAADAGNIFAAWELVPMAIAGSGIQRDLMKARGLFMFSYVGGLPAAIDFIDKARAGNRTNKRILAQLHINPRYMPRTVGEFFNDARNGNKPTEARHQLEVLVAQHNGAAYGYLAELVRRGIGGTANLGRAVDLYLQQATQGGYFTLFYAGTAFANGINGKLNFVAAATCFLLMQSLDPKDAALGAAKSEQAVIRKLSPSQRAAIQELKGLLARIAAGSQVASGR